MPSLSSLGRTRKRLCIINQLFKYDGELDAPRQVGISPSTGIVLGKTRRMRKKKNTNKFKEEMGEFTEKLCSSNSLSDDDGGKRCMQQVEVNDSIRALSIRKAWECRAHSSCIMYQKATLCDKIKKTFSIIISFVPLEHKTVIFFQYICCVNLTSILATI